MECGLGESQRRERRSMLWSTKSWDLWTGKSTWAPFLNVCRISPVTRGGGGGGAGGLRRFLSSISRRARITRRNTAASIPPVPTPGTPGVVGWSRDEREEARQHLSPVLNGLRRNTEGQQVCFPATITVCCEKGGRWHADLSLLPTELRRAGVSQTQHGMR